MHSSTYILNSRGNWPRLVDLHYRWAFGTSLTIEWVINRHTTTLHSLAAQAYTLTRCYQLSLASCISKDQRKLIAIHVITTIGPSFMPRPPSTTFRVKDQGLIYYGYFNRMFVRFVRFVMFVG